jgi:hypothetical protein
MSPWHTKGVEEIAIYCTQDSPCRHLPLDDYRPPCCFMYWVPRRWQPYLAAAGCPSMPTPRFCPFLRSWSSGRTRLRLIAHPGDHIGSGAARPRCTGAGPPCRRRHAWRDRPRSVQPCETGRCLCKSPIPLNRHRRITSTHTPSLDRARATSSPAAGECWPRRLCGAWACIRGGSRPRCPRGR